MNVNSISSYSSPNYISFGKRNNKKSVQSKSNEQQNAMSNPQKSVTNNPFHDALLWATAIAQATSMAAAVLPPAQAQAETVQAPASIVEQAELPSLDMNFAELSQITVPPMPVSEFYFAQEGREIQLHPNKNLSANENGTIIIGITEFANPDNQEGATLREIITETYSDALSQYRNDEQRTAIFNKIIDETIQANPELSDYVHEQLGHDADSYDAIADLNLYTQQGTLSSGVISLPTTVVYKDQGRQTSASFQYSSRAYTPNSERASVDIRIGKSRNGRYRTFSEMVYGEYGKDISDEAYRDIVYSIVSHPENKGKFDINVGEMTLRELLHADNIHDLNRTLDENLRKSVSDIYLPAVRTLRTQDRTLTLTGGGKYDTVYQISPAKVREDQDDREILLTSSNGQGMQPGDVFMLRDVLQFYSSPDGNGRFATVVNGKLQMNPKVNYANEFGINILEQVVYANLDKFTEPYSIGDEYYPYGVFNLSDGYDVTGKSYDEILEHLTIDLGRLVKFSFEDHEGEELHLPQFNYVIHRGQTQVVETPTPPATVTPVPVTPTPEPTSTCPPVPTIIPTDEPEPTLGPTDTPTEAPTEAPTVAPTEAPTEAPTQAPTQQPQPTASDIPVETPGPTEKPTPQPSQQPTEAPTTVPTQQPTEVPCITPEPFKPHEEEEPVLVTQAPPTQKPTKEPPPEPTLNPPTPPCNTPQPFKYEEEDEPSAKEVDIEAPSRRGSDSSSSSSSSSTSSSSSSTSSSSSSTSSFDSEPCTGDAPAAIVYKKEDEPGV